MDRAQKLGHVTSVEQAGVGNDGKTTYVTINFDQGAGDVEHTPSPTSDAPPRGR